MAVSFLDKIAIQSASSADFSQEASSESTCCETNEFVPNNFRFRNTVIALEDQSFGEGTASVRDIIMF
jgi:hypothetical protein